MAAAIRDVSIDEDMPDDTNAIQAECSLNLQTKAHRGRFAAANKRQIKKARRARALGENGIDYFWSSLLVPVPGLPIGNPLVA
ncbi:hypothetical protein IVA96_12790 [Bradyrhizobium sp. 159]|uniref:hypothetical protein n=1 Tax=Bradyrhizobium sp. 159 TaxID=2782632 RepID=UPI001FF823A7|nr:hypothetical protein [Bradyrhizobium sp. 159]MCK1617507.1 hypothetical protein [Bradyrhizobium sp. 159]